MKHLILRNIIVVMCLLWAATGLCLSHSGVLPVMYIDTENHQAIVSKQQGYVNGYYWLESNGIPGVEDVGSAEEPLPLQIKARGNYTWTGFDKKPYKLKLGSKTALMGMDKNKHFALLAHADDPTGFSRNIAGFELSRRMGLDWTPTDRPLELYLNGDYIGLYFLTETIRIDPTRVDITEQKDEASDNVDGGWLVEIDNYDTDPHVTVTEKDGSNYPIWITYKSPEKLSPAQEAYLSGQINAINEAIYSSDKSTTELKAIIDLESAARFYIVQELTENTESYHGSCYLYKDRGADALWYFGPVWDFGNAFIRDGGYKNKFVWQQPAFHQVWIGELYKFPAFRDKVKEVWREFCDNGYLGFEEYMLSYARTMLPAQDANFARWPQYGNSDIMTRIERTIDMIRHNMKWLGQQWEYVPQLPETVYLRGDFNGWDTSMRMCCTSEGVYEISLADIEAAGYTFSGGSRFKLATADWSTIDLGAEADNLAPVPGTPFRLVTKGRNIIVPHGLTDHHTLMLNIYDNTLTITDNASVIDPDADSAITPEIYTLTGQRLTVIPEKGIYILRYPHRILKIAY